MILFLIGPHSLGLITAIESVLFLLQYVSEDLDNREKIIVMGDCCYLNPLVRRTFRFLGTCVCVRTCFSTDIFVNAGQVVTGNLSPHFLTVCKPNYTALGCMQTARFVNQKGACTGNEDDIMRSRKSFPSKEAALSVYAALYTATVQGERCSKISSITAPSYSVLPHFQFQLKVVEYRNHWCDVIAGFIIGGAIAVFMVLGVVQNFKGKTLLNEIPPEESVASSVPMMGQPRIMDNTMEKYIASQNPLTFAEVT
ncbi:unnamed protein product [Coregonus sp. 'balchen']|nr:unnamed protein product [Coregonus sp. 'balchen']